MSKNWRKKLEKLDSNRQTVIVKIQKIKQTAYTFFRLFSLNSCAIVQRTHALHPCGAYAKIISRNIFRLKQSKNCPENGFLSQRSTKSNRLLAALYDHPDLPKYCQLLSLLSDSLASFATGELAPNCIARFKAFVACDLSC